MADKSLTVFRMSTDPDPCHSPKAQSAKRAVMIDDANRVAILAALKGGENEERDALGFAAVRHSSY